MKVLFINTVFGKGSTGRIVKQLGDMVEANGGEYVVAYGRGEVIDAKHSYYIGNKIDRYIHAGLSRITDRTGFYSKHCTKELVRFIREYNPELIHLHNLHGYYINVQILFTYLKEEYSGRIIWTLHDCWAFTGHCTHFTYVKCEKWKKGCSNCPEKNNYPSSMVIDHSRINYDQKKALFTGLKNMTIVTVSEWLKEVTEKSFLKEYEINRIYNGIDIDRFKPVETNLRERLGFQDKRIILSVSDGWNDRKGFSKIKDIAKVSPNDWMFILVGANKKQIDELPSNIIGIEHVWNQDELIEYYSISDVFFNPSIEETFGLVTAEAMACGTFAVVFNSTACPEIIGTKSTGISLDIDASVDEITKALSYSGDLCLTRDEIRRRFSINSFIENYLQLYEKR